MLEERDSGFAARGSEETRMGLWEDAQQANAERDRRTAQLQRDQQEQAVKERALLRQYVDAMDRLAIAAQLHRFKGYPSGKRIESPDGVWGWELLPRRGPQAQYVVTREIEVYDTVSGGHVQQRGFGRRDIWTFTPLALPLYRLQTSVDYSQDISEVIAERLSLLMRNRH